MALAAHEHEVILGAHQAGRDQLVGNRNTVVAFHLSQVDGDEAAAAVGVVRGESRLLYEAALGSERQVRLVLIGAQVKYLGDLFAWLERKHVSHVLALGITTTLGKLVRLGAVDTAQVGEEQQPVMRGGDKEVADDVVTSQGGAANPLAAPALRAVLRRLGALGVAASGDGHHHLFFSDEVLDGDFAVKGADHCASVVTVLAHNLVKLLTNDGALAGLGLEDGVEILDLLHERVVVIGDLLALQRGEAAKLQVEDRCRLNLIHLEELHEALARSLNIG